MAIKISQIKDKKHSTKKPLQENIEYNIMLKEKKTHMAIFCWTVR